MTFTNTADKLGFFSLVTNDAIDGKRNYEFPFTAVLPSEFIPLARFEFLPNPDNGQSTLVSPVNVAAGFAAGLSPVGFSAPQGTDLSTLASMLNSALQAGGYLTSMPSSTDVLVFSRGLGLPAEIDFSIDPIGQVGDQGVDAALVGMQVPEPPSILGLFAAVIALGIRKTMAQHA